MAADKTLHFGGQYEGDWQDGALMASAALKPPSFSYVGGVGKQGQLSGKGQKSWANGDQYEGSGRIGKQSGSGKFTSADGEKYVGEWKEGKQSGMANFSWADGGHVRGGMEGGNVGWARGLTPASRSKSRGSFKAGKLHGQGEHTRYSLTHRQKNKWKVVGHYKGEWKDGFAHGQGEVTWANGNKHVGEIPERWPHRQDGYLSHCQKTGAIVRKYVGRWQDRSEAGGMGSATLVSCDPYAGDLSGRCHWQDEFICQWR
eukprot:jgi/Botrbrau1/12482/Bobra.0169s0029.1